MTLKRIYDCQPYLCREDETVRAAMSRIDQLGRLSSGGRPFQFLLVLGQDGRMVGTLTDGDIRRGILSGCALTDPVAKCVFRSPKVGGMGQDAENLQLLRSLAGQSSFLPILNGQGELVEILVLASDRDAECSVLIMAGGFGKRLGERTRHTPKPLLPVGDKPILGHILDRIAGIHPTRIFLSVHYLADQVEAFAAGRPERASIDLLHEQEPLGTAGAVGLLPSPLPYPVVVSNGDILTSLDFSAFKQFYDRHSYDAVIAVAQHDVTVPFGVVRHTDEGHFLRIDEKPTLTHYVSAGIYMLSPEFRALVNPNERIDMPELLQRGQKIGLQIGLFPLHEHWTDVGRPEDLALAEQNHSTAR